MTGEPIVWVRQPQWIDGEIHRDLPGESAANFLYRTIRSEREATIKLALGSDDAIRIYVNNEKALDRDVERAVAADQDTVELKLKAGENHLLVKLVNYQGSTGFYFKIMSPEMTVVADAHEIAHRPAEQRSPDEQQRLRDFYRNSVADSQELKSLRLELAQKREAVMAIDRQIATTLIWREKKEAVPAHILNRGEYDKPGDQVSRRIPAVLPPMAAGLPNNRLGLAKWLVEPAHPLTARVAANRLWQQVFGTGIVKTSEDFGSQGEPPSHPELLDWLAVDFRENGWDVKRLMKHIVMSATYRQSSTATPELLERDPANRLLARNAVSARC